MAEFRVGNVYAVRGALASLPHPSASPSVEYVAFDTLVGKSGKTTLGRKYIETPSLGTLLEGATLGPKLYDKGEKEREERQHTTINRIIARYSEARLREGVLARRNKERTQTLAGGLRLIDVRLLDTSNAPTLYMDLARLCQAYEQANGSLLAAFTQPQLF